MREGEGKYIGKKLKKRKNVSETHRWGDSRIDPLFKSGKVVDCVENLRTANSFALHHTTRTRRRTEKESGSI